jgi:hypothetical protein
MKATPDMLHEVIQIKKKRRKELSQLPIEQKVKILLDLQMMASPILSQRGIQRKPWKIRP